MSVLTYFDLGKYQKDYSVAYGKFREYIRYRIQDEIFDQWIEINSNVELGMKNAIIPAMEGYLINFFIKHDIKISIAVDKFGEWMPRVYTCKNGLYSTNMTAKYTLRNEAVLRAIDCAFSKLNIELIINSKAIDHNGSN